MVQGLPTSVPPAVPRRCSLLCRSGVPPLASSVASRCPQGTGGPLDRCAPKAREKRAVPTRRGGGGYFRFGEISAPPNSFGYTADPQNMFWDEHWVHKISLWGTQETQETNLGIRTRIKTDPDMQYAGTDTLPLNRNGNCRLNGLRIAQKVSGGGGGISAPVWETKVSPTELPPPTHTHHPPNGDLLLRAPAVLPHPLPSPTLGTHTDTRLCLEEGGGVFWL